MMIWMPYSSFEKTARCLDDKTLTIQRFDAFRVLNILKNQTPKEYLEKPLFKMWKGHELWLVCYGIAMCHEKERRLGRETEVKLAFLDHLKASDLTDPFPTWASSGILHTSHRSNMLQLNFEHYSNQWPGVVEGLPLFFPEETL